MSTRMAEPVSPSEIAEDKRKKYGYNLDYEIKWLKFSDKQRNKPGSKSIVNHKMAEKLVSMKRAEIVSKDVKRTLPEDPNQKKKK